MRRSKVRSAFVCYVLQRTSTLSITLDVTSDAAKHLEAAREKLKNALTALAPRDTDDIRSGMVMDKFGDEFTRSLIERTLGKVITNWRVS